MDIYLYCSYENSKRGFYLTRLEDDGLVAENLSGATDRCGQLVAQFFAYDDFRILWQEFPRSGAFPLFPTAECGMFGIRGMQGEMSGRRGVCNLAITAGADELTLLGHIAAGIIAAPDAFASALFGCLSVGGAYGYDADANALRALIDGIGSSAASGKNIPAGIRELLSGDAMPVSDRSLLRFAVYVSTWEQAAEHMTPSWLWKKRPPRAFSTEEFAALLYR